MADFATMSYEDFATRSKASRLDARGASLSSGIEWN